MSVARMLDERREVLVDRMRALEDLRESGETTVFDPEYDRLVDELEFMVALAAEYRAVLTGEPLRR